MIPGSDPDGREHERFYMANLLRSRSVATATLLVSGLFLGACTQTGASNGTIVSAQPEASEDCEALRESLRSNNSDNQLDAFDIQELDRRGC